MAKITESKKAKQTDLVKSADALKAIRMGALVAALCPILLGGCDPRPGTSSKNCQACVDSCRGDETCVQAHCALLCQGSSTSPLYAFQGSFFLAYNNTFDQPENGPKTQVVVPVVWQGSRQPANAEEPQPQGVGNTFKVNSTWNGYATDPWYTTIIVPNLNPGNWNLSVTVNGQPMACGSPITLATGSPVSVTFEVDKISGKFAGCTHN